MKMAVYDSPAGRLMVGVHGGSVCLCDWVTGQRIETTLRRINKFLPPSDTPDDMDLLENTRLQLHEYFSGIRSCFDLPVEAMGTAFQRRVWDALLQIPYGETSTYKDIALSVGSPRGVRAVASAIGTNPLSVIIPCHRVVGSDGSLTGYAGGLAAKKFLLQLESTRDYAS